MLQALREKSSGLLAKVLLGAIVLAFSFFGIESYFISRTDDFVAKVGDREISQQDFRTRFDEYRQRELQRSGGTLDMQTFEQPQIKRQLLDAMIDEQVLVNANRKLGISVPAEALRQQIRAIPAFQHEGQFDPTQYKALLAAQGMTPASFEERLRREMSANLLPMQIATSEFVTAREVDDYLRLRDQKRDFRHVMLAKPTLAEHAVSDADAEAYYKAHSQDFMVPEEVALEYLELDAAKLDVNVTPDEATLRDRYEKEKARYVSPEQREASHILIKVGGKGTPDDQKAALEKAQKITAEAKAGKDFAALAKEYSDDLGSKALGGDLGWLEKDVTDPAFEGALYALQKGEISDPVLSPEGYHIIELRDVRPGTTRSFEEVRPELARDFGDSERERVYNERSGRLTDLTYQDASSLDGAAHELGLTVQKTGLFPRAGGEGIAANPAVVKAAFSEQVLVQNNNSDPIDLGPNHIVVVRVAEHKPAKPKALADVRGAIDEAIRSERLAAQAKAQADALYARLGKGEKLDQLAAELKLEVASEKDVQRSAVNLDGALVRGVFDMPRPGDKPTHALIALGDDAYTLVALDKVSDADPKAADATTREAARNTLLQGMMGDIARNLVAGLRADTKLKVAEDRL